jgi:hypothetical protein
MRDLAHRLVGRHRDTRQRCGLALEGPSIYLGATIGAALSATSGGYSSAPMQSVDRVGAAAGIADGLLGRS